MGMEAGAGRRWKLVRETRWRSMAVSTPGHEAESRCLFIDRRGEAQGCRRSGGTRDATPLSICLSGQGRLCPCLFLGKIYDNPLVRAPSIICPSCVTDMWGPILPPCITSDLYNLPLFT